MAGLSQRLILVAIHHGLDHTVGLFDALASLALKRETLR